MRGPRVNVFDRRNDTALLAEREARAARQAQAVEKQPARDAAAARAAVAESRLQVQRLPHGARFDALRLELHPYLVAGSAERIARDADAGEPAVRAAVSRFRHE